MTSLWKKRKRYVDKLDFDFDFFFLKKTASSVCLINGMDVI